MREVSALSNSLWLNCDAPIVLCQGENRRAHHPNLRYEPKAGQRADLKKRTQPPGTTCPRTDFAGFRDRHGIYDTNPICPTGRFEKTNPTARWLACAGTEWRSGIGSGTDFAIRTQIGVEKRFERRTHTATECVLRPKRPGFGIDLGFAIRTQFGPASI